MNSLRDIAIKSTLLAMMLLPFGCATPSPQIGPLLTTVNEDRVLIPAASETPAGKRQQARARAAKKKSPGSSRASLALARTALARGDARAAESWARRSIALDFRDPEPKLALAQALLVAGRREDARSVIALTGSVATSNVRALNLLGIIAWQDGDALKSEAYFTKAVKADQKDSAAKLNLAVARLRRGNTEGAIAELRQVLAVDRRNPDARRHLGIAFARQGKLDDAEEMYQSIEGWRESSRVLADLALVYRRAERWDDALEALSDALAMKDVRVAERETMVALLEEIKGERAATGPSNAAEIDKLIASAKKSGKPLRDDDGMSGWFLSGLSPERD